MVQACLHYAAKAMSHHEYFSLTLLKINGVYAKPKKTPSCLRATRG